MRTCMDSNTHSLVTFFFSLKGYSLVTLTSTKLIFIMFVTSCPWAIRMIKQEERIIIITWSHIYIFKSKKSSQACICLPFSVLDRNLGFISYNFMIVKTLKKKIHSYFFAAYLFHNRLPTIIKNSAEIASYAKIRQAAKWNQRCIHKLG